MPSMLDIEPILPPENRQHVEIEYDAARLKSDFFYFVSAVFRELRKKVRLGNPCLDSPEDIKAFGPVDPDEWVDKDVCDWVQHGPRKRGVLMWRLAGKALTLDTPLPTPGGWTTMGEVREGDTLFDENGQPCKVTFATEVQHGRECFRLTFSDHTTIDADRDHRWTVLDAKSNKAVTVTTGDMIGNLTYPPGNNRGEKRFALPRIGPIMCKEADLPIHPYVLGAWLGNGHTSGGYITYHRDDEEAYLSAFRRCGFVLTPKPRNDRGKARTGLIEGFQKIARKNGLLRNKHIPSAYLRGSFEQRLDLLRGLMDTDGHIDKKGRCEFSTSSPVLRDGAAELMRTLGLRPNVMTRRARIYGRDVGECYRIGFEAGADIPVFAMPRKLGRMNASSRSKSRKVVSIEPIPSVPVRCIQVDSPSHLFLAGRGFVPTHNTESISICYSLWLFYRDKNHKVIIISQSGQKAKEFLLGARQYIEIVPFLNHLAPRGRSVGGRKNRERDRADAFDIGGCTPDPKDPSFIAKGIDGMITGSHAHTLIADDIETHQNSQTVTQRDNLRNKTNEFAAIIYDGGEIIDVGTFHSEESVHKELAVPDQGGRGTITYRTWPVIYPASDQHFCGLSPTVRERLDKGLNRPGDILAPYRVTRQFVTDRQVVGARWFNLQYMCQSNVRETNRYPLLLENLIVFDSGKMQGPLEIVWGKKDSSGSSAINDIEMSGWTGDRLYPPVRISKSDEWVNYQRIEMTVDPGGSGKSLTAWAAGASLNGFVYIHELHGKEGGAANIPAIADCALRCRANRIYVEGNLGSAYDIETNPFAGQLQVELNKRSQPAGTPEFPNGWGCAVDVIHSAVQKDQRIVSTLEPAVTSHRLVVSRQVASNQRFQHQFAKITVQRGSLASFGYDELDVVAMLVARLAGTFLIDNTKAVKSRLEEMLDNEMKARMGLAGRRGRIFEYRC